MGLTRMVLGPAPLSAGVFDLRLTRPPLGGRVGGRHSGASPGLTARASLFTGRPTCPIRPRS